MDAALPPILQSQDSHETELRLSTILVVDDDPMCAKLLTALFETDHHVHVATNGAEALTLVEEVTPDIILLDVMMPVKNGYEVCRELKQRAATAEIPVIFITARNDFEAELIGLEAGAVDYIGKPINPAVVMRRVHTHLQLKKARDSLGVLANTDPLTGVGNRRMGLDRIESLLAQRRRTGEAVAVLLIDLDRFKQVNDNLGHKAGDEVLSEVARRFGDCLRDTDVLARLGGDEFLIGLSGLDAPEKAAVVAQRVIDCLSESPLTGRGDLDLTPSIGIAIAPADAPDLTGLLKFADQAMYTAKDEGRARYRFFSRDIHDRAVAKARREDRLRHAVAEQRFELHFQEQVDLESGALVSVEALLRATDPELGSPAQFVPLAEELSLMDELGAFSLLNSLRQMQRWKANGLLLERVAVNVSAKQFQDPQLASRIARALEDYAISPDLLEIEVTETAAMHSAEDAIRSLKAIKDLGVAIAIDDFGTGYSSLAYLRRFPIDRIKIDRAFVMNLESHPEDVEIVKAIISLAKTMRLSVLAEGVETQGQWAVLRDLGCELAQGYLFGKPKPAALIGSSVVAAE
jgi:diguanylate cyclase (GGDEF)-like protein